MAGGDDGAGAEESSVIAVVRGVGNEGGDEVASNIHGSGVRLSHGNVYGPG